MPGPTPGPTPGALPRSGCRAASCGTAAGADGLPPEVWRKVKDHPCYSQGAHHFFARMHVAVAPACNIQCRYCNRKYDCVNESRPGVVSETLTPEAAARKVLWVASEMPQLSVVGIAGPGDALADPRRTFETCARVAEALPDVALCLSTNGLTLPDCVDRITAHRIDHVTVTINAIDPAVAERIYAWVAVDKRRRTGRDAARLLIERQWHGLDLLVAAGVLVKVNSVMIPGVNDTHLAEVNAELKRRGAFLHNIVPLISDPTHGTEFGLSGQRGPTATELSALQGTLGGGAQLMKHCRQCRADAVGLLGEDRGSRFALTQMPAAPTVDPERRRVYRAVVDRERADQDGASATAESRLHGVATDESRLVAVCTKGGGRINRHFGHTHEFQVYRVDRSGVRLDGHRRSPRYCQGGYGEDAALEATIAALDGVSTILCVRIGNRPRTRLAAAGIRADESHAHAYIETAVADVFLAEFGTLAAAAG